MRLEGERAIRDYLGWDESRFQRHRSTLKADGVLLYEYRGRPRKKHMWTMTELLHHWLIKMGQEGKIF